MHTIQFPALSISAVSFRVLVLPTDIVAVYNLSKWTSSNSSSVRSWSSRKGGSDTDKEWGMVSTAPLDLWSF